MANLLGKAKGWMVSLGPAHRGALIMALAAFLWIASGVFYGEDSGAEDVAASVPASVSLPQVRVASINPESRASQLSLFGRTEASRNVLLKSETKGRVSEVVVPKGHMANKGDVIVRLEMDDRAARLEDAKAFLAQQQITYDAARKLSQEGFQSRLKLAEAKAGQAAAVARLKAIEEDIARTDIRAPFTGVVNDVPVEAGDFIDVATPVAQVVDLTSVLVAAEVSERYAPSIQSGAPAQVRLADGREFTGRLSYVSRVSNKDTRTFKIEVMIDSPDASIAEGLTAALKLDVASNRAHRISPAILTLSEDGVIGVMAVDATDEVRFYPVTLVGDTTDGIWVSGLPDSIRIIVVGQEYVRAGQKVVAVDAKAMGGLK